jgi:hypothetical protein
LREGTTGRTSYQNCCGAPLVKIDVMESQMSRRDPIEKSPFSDINRYVFTSSLDARGLLDQVLGN